MDVMLTSGFLVVLLAILGPRELCIVRSAAVPLIFGPKSKCRKSTWYAQVDVKNKECSVHMTRDFENHRLRRRAWDQGFSVKGEFAKQNQ